MNWSIFGLLATILLPLIPIPQIYSVWKNKSGEGLSVMYILLQILANGSLAIYGFSLSDLYIGIANVLIVFGNITLIALKYYYARSTTDRDNNEINDIEGEIDQKSESKITIHA